MSGAPVQMPNVIATDPCAFFLRPEQLLPIKEGKSQFLYGLSHPKILPPLTSIGQASFGIAARRSMRSWE